MGGGREEVEVVGVGAGAEDIQLQPIGHCRRPAAGGGRVATAAVANSRARARKWQSAKMSDGELMEGGREKPGVAKLGKGREKRRRKARQEE